MNSMESNIHDIFQLYRKAKCCLVLRRFKEAVQLCCEVLGQKENGDKPPCRIPEQRTPFVIIAVQAYAEMNQYHTAVGFASKVFGNAEKFPPEVLELCICLLLKVSQHVEADELAEKWLCCEENFSHQKYLEVTEFYVKNVLFPRGLHGKIQQFLETNRALSTEQKQAMLNASRTFNEKLERSSSPVGSDSSDVAVHCKSKQKQGIHYAVVIRMLAVMDKLQRLCRNISYSQWPKSVTILRILILLFFVYALLTASGYQGVTPGSGILIFWQAVLKAWRAMFSPYHLM